MKMPLHALFFFSSVTFSMTNFKEVRNGFCLPSGQTQIPLPPKIPIYLSDKISQ